MDDSESFNVCTDVGMVSENEWFLLSVTYEEGLAQIYLNGKLIETSENQNLRFSDSCSDLFIGGEMGKSGFNGWIDEISIFSRALDLKKIKDLYLSGFPKIYRQTRESIDPDKRVWNNFKGNQLIPHPIDEHTIFAASFDGTLRSITDVKPIEMVGVNEEILVPGQFGGAYNALSTSSFDDLTYDISIEETTGTIGIWFIPLENNEKEWHLFEAKGNDNSLLVFYKDQRWRIRLKQGSKEYLLTSKPLDFRSSLIHLGFTWKKQEICFYINGVEQACQSIDQLRPWSGPIQIGGEGNNKAGGYIDDINISSEAKNWTSVCPTGHIDTESASLDFRDDFNFSKNQPLFLWSSFSNPQNWGYSVKKWELNDKNISHLKRAVYQSQEEGRNTLYHPSAYGFSSSAELGVSFDELKDGWAGIFVKSDYPKNHFSGLTFMINPKRNLIALAEIFRNDTINFKAFSYDFTFKNEVTYTLTLSSVNGVLRGYIDGNNLISMKEINNWAKGYAGMITQNTNAYFDDFHFSPLTPSIENSRKIEQKYIIGNRKSFIQPKNIDLHLSAFRWKKRQGFLPWQKKFKEPEPPGNIFGPATDVVMRPNKSSLWRSEDAANSDILMVDSKIYYFMRGNRDYKGPHGVATIGILNTDFKNFDGLHFIDQNSDKKQLTTTELLRGHQDNSNCPDSPPRNKRFQLNDQGGAYIDRKIVLFAREFKNPIASFRRLVYGIYDLRKKKWENNGEPYTVEWSQMNTDSCYSKKSGLNATPEIIALRDPSEKNNYTLFLYHKGKDINGIPASMISGLKFNNGKLVLDKVSYPAKVGITKKSKDAIYGERILFDNGIYYMNVNAGSDKTKLSKDWPDRFELYTNIHPYNGDWISSKENDNLKRPYFTRGNEFDSDNAAIWQGTMFKFRNRYYMYYENYHSIENRNKPYDQYNAVHSGSRVGFSTAN